MEAVKIASRSDDECAILGGIGDKIVEDKVIKDSI